MEFGKALPYDIKITPTHNKGFIVKVGCCTAVFTDKKSLIGALDEYLSDPSGIEQLYISKCALVDAVRVERPSPPEGRPLGRNLVSSEGDQGNCLTSRG